MARKNVHSREKIGGYPSKAHPGMANMFNKTDASLPWDELSRKPVSREGITKEVVVVNPLERFKKRLATHQKIQQEREGRQR